MKLDLEIEGPESIAISPNENVIYTGIVGGDIVRINDKGEVKTVVKFGQECGKTSFCFINIYTSFIRQIRRRRMGNT